MKESLFKYPTLPIANGLINLNVNSVSKAFSYVKNLPYGRNKRRDGYLNIIVEGKGTCSSKHAFLKSLLIEQEVKDWTLLLGIFKMNGINTPKVKEVLDHYDVDFIPEGHIYLMNNGKRYDMTFADSDITTIEQDILQEIEIDPYMVVDFKVDYHKNYLSNWILTENSNFTFDEIWSIREQCILKLSE